MEWVETGGLREKFHNLFVGLLKSTCAQRTRNFLEESLGAEFWIFRISVKSPKMEVGVDIWNGSVMEVDDPIQEVPLDLSKKSAEIVTLLCDEMKTDGEECCPTEETEEEQAVPLNLKVEVLNILPIPQEDSVPIDIDDHGEREDEEPTRVKDVEKEELTAAQKPRRRVRKLVGRIEVVRKVTRKFFCKICMAEVPSMGKLVIHLDREHKILVKGPPRVVNGRDR